jgi:hypothetical protein
MSLKAIQLQLKASELIAKNIVAENEKNIEAAIPKMIRSNWKQLDEGRKNDNNPITPLYSPSYAKKKGFSIPDLKVTGDFRNSFDIDFRTDKLIWGAGDEKAPHLISRYGANILGLTEENAALIFEDINKKRNNYVEKITKRYY